MQKRIVEKMERRLMCDFKEKNLHLFAVDTCIYIKAVCGWRVEINSAFWLKKKNPLPLPLRIIASSDDHLEIILICKKIAICRTYKEHAAGLFFCGFLFFFNTSL